jgi:hypothetical protein
VPLWASGCAPFARHRAPRFPTSLLVLAASPHLHDNALHAGEYWLAMDPFWTRQGPQMQRLYCVDGSVVAPPDEPLWGEHLALSAAAAAACCLLMWPVYTACGCGPAASLQSTPAAHRPAAGEHECRWRFCKSKEGRPGHYIKANHWPSLTISRTPSGSWVMENLWVVHEAVLGRARLTGRALALHRSATSADCWLFTFRVTQQRAAVSPAPR